jgi:Multidrug resistance efflux pump
LVTNNRTMDEEKREKNKIVELRSEELQEVMGKMPSWIVRWGVTTLFVVVFAILVGSVFFKYPDTIVTSMTLSSREPVAHIVARASARISSLYVIDGDIVKKGDYLAVLENPASTDDILTLKRWLVDNPNIVKASYNDLLEKEYSLGDIHSLYIAFLRTLNEYSNYKTLNYYPQKISSMEKRLSEYSNYRSGLKRQYEVVEEQYTISNLQFKRDSSLFSRGVISLSDFENAKKNLLQQQHSLESAGASIENTNIQISSLRESLLDLKLQQAEKERTMSQEYRSAYEQLQNGINTWELSYCLMAPLTGKVTFVNYWNENQFVTVGNPVFSIVPDNASELIGISLLPVHRSGKVKQGQRVIIRLANYPDQEFGILNGVVNSISLVPSGENYRVEIGLPDGLTTNYRIDLPPAQELQGSAEIVTEDLRLIERFFMPVKKMLKEGL